MFQRLKGAFDSIAEEQARQRAGPRLNANGSSRTGFISSPDRSSLPGSEAESISGPSPGSGPVPDPNAFEPDRMMSDGNASRPNQELVPNHRSSRSQVPSNLPDGSDAEIAPLDKAPAKGTNGSTEASTMSSLDTESKLRRLHKLESKYQELLRAYRRAHARLSTIELFETRLRESTPLTSINDPDALSDFLNQVNTKSQMVIDELNRVTKENEENKKRLEEVNKRSVGASQETSQLKRRNERAAVSQFSERETQGSHTEGAPFEQANNRGSWTSTSSVRLSEQNNAKSENMFFVDDEIPRLQDELQDQVVVVSQLKEENVSLREKLLVAEESTEQMMHDLKMAKLEIHSYSEKLQAQQSQLAEMGTIVDKQNFDISVYKSKLESKESLILQKDKLVVKLQGQDSEQSSHNQNQIRGLEDCLVMPKAKADTLHLRGNAIHPVETETLHPWVDLGTRNTSNCKEMDKSFSDSSERFEVDADEHLDTIDERDLSIQRLKAKLRDQGDLCEEIEILKDELINVGQEHVEAKEAINALRDENQRLLDELSRCKESQSADFSTDHNASHHLSNDDRDMEAAHHTGQSRQGNARQVRDVSGNSIELNPKYKSLEVELRAAQRLASTRYKDILHTQEMLQKFQSELASTRVELKEAKASRDEMSSSAQELRRLESQEESLKFELSSLRQGIIAKDNEIRTSNQKLEQEATQRISAEETARKHQREVQKGLADLQETSNVKDNAFRELAMANKELQQLRDKVKNLDVEVKELVHETKGLRDELAVKTAQHASAESMIGNVRDQAAEIAVQMKETKQRCESLEEELSDAHRLMSERGRESETMRHLLTEAEKRSESRLKEAKERIDIALQERDNAEAEAAAAGRRRARESEEFKAKARGLEHDLRSTEGARKSLEGVHKVLRDENERDKHKIEQLRQGLNEVTFALGELRDLFDKNESQTRVSELQKAELKREAGEARQNLERLQKTLKATTEELRTLRLDRVKATESSQQSSRASTEFLQSYKIKSPVPSGREVSPSLVGPEYSSNIDLVYLKNILLQFLEQKDKSHQLQLLPVLSMILHFNKKEEQRWMTVVNAR